MKFLLSIAFALFSLSIMALEPDEIPEHDSFTIESEKVGETRVITVWTPKEYSFEEINFPVLYMPDGGIKEDFPHIANTLSKLIASKSIKPVILVGIENTERGRDLTGFSSTKKDGKYCPLTDGAENFRAFIAEELMVEIDQRYRTTSYKGIIGESLAGLFVVETFFEQPDLFDAYIAMDPSLWWNKHYLVKNAEEVLANFTTKEIKFWFAGSSAKDISKYTNKLAEILESSAPDNVDWKYLDQPEEFHHTIFRATKEKALYWAFDTGVRY